MVLFSKSVYFDGFIFEVGIYFEVLVAILHKLFECDDITKLFVIEQHCNYRCSVTLSFLKSHAAGSLFVTANRGV